MYYLCPSCGRVSDEIPCISADRPYECWDVPEAEQGRRLGLTSERCIIDGKRFFTSGVIEVPVHDHPHSLRFGVWISQRPEEFFAYRNNPDSGEIGPFSGRLASRIMFFDEDTRSLKATVRFLGGGRSPKIELAAAKHPLILMQDEGITLDRAWEIIHYYVDP